MSASELVPTWPGPRFQEGSEKDVDAAVDAAVRTRVTGETRLEPRFRVLLHNDPITPMEFVTWLLHQVFGFGYPRSFWIMLKAHRTGIAQVAIESRAEAQRHVAKAHDLARARGWLRLTFSVEPLEE